MVFNDIYALLVLTELNSNSTSSTAHTSIRRSQRLPIPFSFNGTVNIHSCWNLEDP